MDKLFALTLIAIVGCAPGTQPGTPSECPDEPRTGEIVVGTEEVWLEDAQGFCEGLGGSLASLADLEEILVAYREMSDPDVHGWVREVSFVDGRRSRYSVGWNGFVTPTIDSLAVAVPVCLIP
jgi:hypothetical protein